MSRVCYFYLLAAIAALGQPAGPDPAFDKIPFEDWLKGGDEAQIQWSLGVPHVYLGGYQRLETTISAVVSGGEFVKRDDPGQMVFFLEIRDHEERTYRSHRVMRLRKTTDPDDLADLKLTEHACIVPGDYEVSAAVYDAKSKEHTLKRIKLRVPEIGDDPLPDVWHGLPHVELTRFCDPQHSSWLSLPLKTEKPVRIEVVVNRSANRNKAAENTVSQIYTLIEWLQVISEMEIQNGSMYVTVLDVDRRKVSFSGKVDGKVISKPMLSALEKTDPYRVDVHTLDDYKENAQFFVSEIRKRLENTVPAETRLVLIVLSAPLKFRKGEDLRPIQATPHSGTRIFYIRYDAPLLGPPSKGGVPAIPPMYGAPDGPWIYDGYRYPSRNPDSLERTLKPLNPWLFNVNNKPSQFRRALGKILSEISH